MFHVLSMSVGEYLKENVFLTVVLAIILALIAALSGIMIYLQVKAKKNGNAAPEEKNENANEEAAKQENTNEEAVKEENAEKPAEKEEPAAEEEKAEKPAESPASAAKKPAEKKSAKAEEKKQEEEKPVGFHDGKWIIRKTQDGKFSFKLYAANGGVMLESSKEYSSLSNAKKGIETYKKNFTENYYQIIATKAGHFVYRLTNANGMLMAVSSNYTSKASCENALESTKHYALNAPVEVITD